MRNFITPTIDRLKKFVLVSSVSWLLILLIFSFPDDILVQLLLMTFLFAFLGYQFYITVFLSFDTQQIYLTCLRIKKKIPLKNITKIIPADQTETSRKKIYIITYKDENSEGHITAKVNPESRRWRQFRLYTITKNPCLER